MKKTIFIFLSSSILVLAQSAYSPVPSTSYTALSTILNGKPNVRTGVGAPSLTCTPYLDNYYDTSTVPPMPWYCKGSPNLWASFQVGSIGQLIYNTGSGLGGASAITTDGTALLFNSLVSLSPDQAVLGMIDVKGLSTNSGGGLRVFPSGSGVNASLSAHNSSDAVNYARLLFQANGPSANITTADVGTPLNLITSLNIGGDGGDTSLTALNFTFGGVTKFSMTNAGQMVVPSGSSINTSGNTSGATGDVQATETDVFMPNASTGTGTNLLAGLVLGSSPTQVITIQSLAQTTWPVGVCVAGCGSTGIADIRVIGIVPCQFDGATTSGDYVVLSATNKGYCHDSGLTIGNFVQQSSPIIGRVLSTNASSGIYTININRLPPTFLKTGTFSQISGVTPCNASNLSAAAYITDSMTTALGAVITVGGGSNFIHMLCALQGASYNWIVGEGATVVANAVPGTFSSLPACTPTTIGLGFSITDSPVNPSGNFWATVTVGGGSSYPLVFVRCDGTNYRID